MGTLADSEDLDEMLHKVTATLHQGLHCLLTSIFRERNIMFVLDTISSDPSIYTLDHSDFIVCRIM